MRVSVTIGQDDGEYVTVEAEHDTDAFSPDVLDNLLADSCRHAQVAARVRADWPEPEPEPESSA